MFWGDLKNTFTEKENSFKAVRLRVVPHLSSGDSRARARENHPTRERRDAVERAWGDFHAPSRFARFTIPEEKWGLLVVYKAVVIPMHETRLNKASEH